MSTPRKFKVEYGCQELCSVEIDEEKAKLHIEEMVKFWSGWEDRVARHNGSMVHVFLEQLGHFIFRNGRLPGVKLNEDEGWYALEEPQGFCVVCWSPYEFDDGELDIEEVFDTDEHDERDEPEPPVIPFDDE